jgi:RNA polymerase sigma-70 factor (ECF subfamily)
MFLDSAQTDEQLLEDIRHGDQSAFDELYRRHWISLYDAAFKRLDNRQQAEDIVQEIFIRIWIRRQELAINNVAAYLHTAVRYKVLSYFSRNKDASNFYEPFEATLTETDTPEQCLIAKELLELVYDFAETLSDRKKQIFLLHIKNKLSTKEIAEVLGITQKSVQNQLGPTLQGLRKGLIPLIIAIMATHF